MMSRSSRDAITILTLANIAETLATWPSFRTRADTSNSGWVAVIRRVTVPPIKPVMPVLWSVSGLLQRRLSLGAPWFPTKYLYAFSRLQRQHGTHWVGNYTTTLVFICVHNGRKTIIRPVFSVSENWCRACFVFHFAVVSVASFERWEAPSLLRCYLNYFFLKGEKSVSGLNFWLFPLVTTLSDVLSKRVRVGNRVICHVYYKWKEHQGHGKCRGTTITSK